MIRVCHMTNVHPAEDVRIFHKECVSLAKAGYEVYLVERGDSYDKNGVHIIGLGDLPNGRRKRMTEGAKRVYQAALALDADIYHLHDPELLPYGLKLKKAGKKVIFDSHEHTAESILEKSWITPLVRYPVYWAFSAYQTFVCRRLDAVVSVTPHLVRYFQDKCAKTAQIANFPIFQENIETPDHAAKRLAFAGGIAPPVGSRKNYTGA